MHNYRHNTVLARHLISYRSKFKCGTLFLVFIQSAKKKQSDSVAPQKQHLNKIKQEMGNRILPVVLQHHQDQLLSLPSYLFGKKAISQSVSTLFPFYDRINW